MKRKLRSGRYARYENGVLHTYRAGDEVELSEAEAIKISGLLIAPPAAVAKAVPAAEEEEPMMAFVDRRTAHDVIEAIDGLKSVEQVKALREAEVGNRGRSTVIRAADSRIAELEEVVP